jgi:hypothetical protein
MKLSHPAQSKHGIKTKIIQPWWNSCHLKDLWWPSKLSSLSFKQVTDMDILLTQMCMVVCSSRRRTNLAISARLFASSAMRLMSLKVFLSENIFVSADWRPCSVRCSAAHAAERASFPKSFLLVKAVYKNWKEKRIMKCILKFARTCRRNHSQVVHNSEQIRKWLANIIQYCWYN